MPENEIPPAMRVDIYCAQTLCAVFMRAKIEIKKAKIKTSKRILLFWLPILDFFGILCYTGLRYN